MYRVLYDDEYLFDPYGDDVITDSNISGEVNAAVYFDFTIASNHRLYNKIEEKAGIVKVYSDSKLLFMGEITDIQEDFYGSKQVSCVDPRDHLNDVLLRPYSTVSGEQPNTAPSSVNGYFQWLIDRYNDGMINPKFHFQVGVNQGAYLEKNNYIYRSSEQFPSVGSELEDKILDTLGGYLTLTYPNDIPTLNLYADVHEANTQMIDFGVNLIDFTKTTGTSEQYTAIRPEGGTPEKDSDDPDAPDPKPTTIESLGDGVTSVDSDYVKKGDVVYCLSAVNRYGYREYSWNESDTTDQQDLLEKAVADLKKKVEPKLTLEVKAVDMALFMEGYDHLECGQVARVRSKPHGVDEYLLVSSMDIDLQDPSQTKYTLGQAFDSLTGEQSSFVKSLNAGINSSLDAVAGLDQTVKDQGILVDQANNNAIIAIEDAQEAQQKAEQAQQAADAANDLAQDSLDQAQQAHDLAEQIQSVVNEVAGDVDQIKTDMEQTEADLAATSQKADQALNKANELAGSIENVTTEISGLQDDFDGLQVTVSGAVENANEALTQVSQTKTDLEGFKTSVSQTYSTKTELDDAIAQEVADRNAAIQVGIDGISATVSQNYTELTSKVNDAQADADAALEAAQTASEDLTNFANEVSGDLTDLQSQIDGSIQTWFYAGVPTLANQPANQWTDSTTRNNHLGDLYYDTTTGYAYRFMLQNDTYSWGKITDSDVTKALQDAAKAQDTADNKRRVFVTTPTPPYDVGDLWVQGSGGDIKRCQTAKSASQSYAASDWVLASKYTDDTKADEVQDDLNEYKNTVATTYATKSSLTQTANEIRAEVAESYQVKGDYATSDDLDDAIAQEVLDRNSAISQSASQIQSTVSQTYATKTALSAIDDKADAAQSAANSAQNDLDDYKTTVSNTYATKSSVTQTANAIRSEVAAEYTTKTEFEGLEIGGRNLLIGSDDDFSKTGTGTAADYSSNKTYKPGSNIAFPGIPTTVMVSVSIKLENVVFASPENQNRNRVGYELSLGGASSSGGTVFCSAWYRITANTETSFEGRVTGGPFKISNMPTSFGSGSMYIQGLKSGTVTVSRPKVEFGTKPTDWSPAPEDMASTDYVQTTYATKTALEQTENSITASVEAKYLSKTDASSTYATKTQLEQTEDSITTTVSQVQTIADNAYAKASQVEQTADGIQITLTEVEATANTANTNATTAKNNAATALSTANTLSGRASQTYSFGGSSSTAWVRLGTLNTGASDTVEIVVLTGIGYNGVASQNSKISIVIRDGNHTGEAANRYGVTVMREGNEGNEVQVRSSAYGTAEVWVHFTGAYAEGSYSISKASDVTWTHSGTVQSSAPTSGTVQSQSYLVNSAAAAKTATNYLKFDSSGLCVGNQSSLGYNTLMTGSEFQVRNGGTVLSSFGASVVRLGQNSASSQIELCAGMGYLRSGSNEGIVMLGAGNTPGYLQLNQDGSVSLHSYSQLGYASAIHLTRNGSIPRAAIDSNEFLFLQDGIGSMSVPRLRRLFSGKTSGTVYLNQAASNYTFLIVMASGNDNVSMGGFVVPASGQFDISVGLAITNPGAYIRRGRWSIRGSTMYCQVNGTWNSVGNTYATAANYLVYITQVWGVKVDIY